MFPEGLTARRRLLTMEVGSRASHLHLVQCAAQHGHRSSSTTQGGSDMCAHERRYYHTPSQLPSHLHEEWVGPPVHSPAPHCSLAPSPCGCGFIDHSEHQWCDCYLLAGPPSHHHRIQHHAHTSLCWPLCPSGLPSRSSGRRCGTDIAVRGRPGTHL